MRKGLSSDRSGTDSVSAIAMSALRQTRHLQPKPTQSLYDGLAGIPIQAFYRPLHQVFAKHSSAWNEGQLRLTEAGLHQKRLKDIDYLIETFLRPAHLSEQVNAIVTECGRPTTYSIKLVHSHNKLLHTKAAYQQSVLASLPALVEAALECSDTRIDHEKRSVCLRSS